MNILVYFYLDHKADAIVFGQSAFQRHCILSGLTDSLGNVICYMNLTIFQKMAEVGNDMVNAKYEAHLPPYYKRPNKADVE